MLVCHAMRVIAYGAGLVIGDSLISIIHWLKIEIHIKKGE